MSELAAGPSDEEVERALTDRDVVAVGKSARNVRMTTIQVAICVGLASLCLLPAVHEALGIPARELAAYFLCVAVSITHTTWAFLTRGGRSRWFDAGVVLDTLVISGGALLLVYRSGDALSPLWIIHAVYLGINIPVGWGWVFGTASVAGPLALVVAFFASGQTADAGVSFVVGVSLCFGYLVAHGNLRAGMRERVRADWLRDRLAEREAELERTRIARDLHDGLGAELSALLWRARDLSAEAGDAARVSDVVRAAEASLDELRTIVGGLRQAETDVGAFGLHLEARLSRLAPATVRVQVSVVAGAEAALDVDARAQLERAIIEAARNAFTHASPDTVTVTLAAEDGALLARVEDDGCGFAEGQGHRSGLRHLEERTAALGGTCAVSSSSDGTRVTIELPLKQRALP